MPFPVLAAIGVGITALAARQKARNDQIIANQQRRFADQQRKDLAELNAQQVRRQTNLEQDKRLPYALSLPSKPANSYSLDDNFPEVTIGGSTFQTKYIALGAIALVLILLVKRST